MEQELRGLASHDLETVGVGLRQELSHALHATRKGGRAPTAWPPNPGQNIVAKNLHRPGAYLGFCNGGEELLVR